MLLCETNTPAVESKVRRAFNQFSGVHGHLHARFQTDFEHGQWWVTCLDCGAQWSVHDAEGNADWVFDGFDFERVSEGDESCVAGE